MLPRGLLKEYSQAIAIVLRLLDMLAIGAAGFIAYGWWFGNFIIPHQYINAILLAAGLTAVVFQFFQIYESIRAKSIWKHIQNLIQALIALLILLAGLAFLTKTGETYSRGWFISLV